MTDRRAGRYDETQQPHATPGRQEDWGQRSSMPGESSMMSAALGLLILGGVFFVFANGKSFLKDHDADTKAKANETQTPGKHSNTITSIPGVRPKTDGEVKLAKYYERKTKNGNHYDGWTFEGKWHGKGTYTWKNGDSYTGHWSHGERDGHGEFTWANGDKYIGPWVAGKKRGEATTIFASGDRHVGLWRDDKLNGPGVHTFKDGVAFETTWVDNVPNEKGKRIDKDGTVTEAVLKGRTLVDPS